MARVMAAQATRSPRYFGKDHGGAGAADVMAGAADALHAAGDEGRRFDLHDEIDGAHVDAEFQGRGGDQAAQRAHLEAVFDFLALVGGDAAVMGADQGFAGEFIDRAGDALGEAAAVDEDERGGVARTSSRSLGWMALQIEGRTGACEAGPLGSVIEFIQARHVVERDFDAQVDALGLAGVDDGDGAIDGRGGGGFELGEDLVGGCRGAVLLAWWRAAAAPPRKRATSSSGRCVAESPMRCSLRPHEGFQAFEREGEMTAALGGDERVDFIEHDGLDGAQDFAGVGGEQQVDGFRSGDQDIGGVAGEAGALERRRCRRCGWRLVGSWNAMPEERAACAMPTSGECRLRSTSTARALMGEM